MKINSINGVTSVNNTERVRAYEPIKKVEDTREQKIQSRTQEEKLKQTSEFDGVKEVLNDEILDKSIEQANKSLEMYHRRIDRSVHEVTKTIMYTIRDTETNEVIQEFPPKKIQDMIAKMWELAGLFVDEKA